MKLNLLSGLFDGLKPTDIITVSEWAERFRWLSSEASFLGGQLYSSLITPYARKIMDSLSVFASYQEIVFCKASQTGGTEIGNNWLGYIIHICPGPALMLMPTDGTVERNSKIRIDPMIEHCPELYNRVAKKKSRDGENTINQKKFPGGVLYMGGANSPAVLKSIPVRYVMLDEVDEYPSDLGGQGSADGLAKVRTRMFPNRKIYYVSTPTVEGVSLIWRKFMETDQNYFNVPCPECGEFQSLEFDNLQWEEGNPESVKYKCIHCGHLISESQKSGMLEKGEWMPNCKSKISKKKIGFHINSLYAPTAFFKWSEVVEEYLKAEKDPNDMKVFVNTILGLPYAQNSDAPKWENLYNRRETYDTNTIPKDVCFLTMGVDVQGDRVELEIVGWCVDKQSYSIDYRVLLGKTTEQDVWNQLHEVIYETWEREDGLEMSIKLTCVDSGAYTSNVYDFCRKYPTNRVIAVKGASSYLAPAISTPKQIDYNKDGKKIGKLKVWMVGGSQIKHEIYAWLGLERNNDVAPPCYLHFPQYAQTYFEGLTAEDWIPLKNKWNKRFKRNEPLDCRVYARAASIVVGLDRLKPHQIQALSGDVFRKKEEKTTNNRRKVENSIW